MKDTKTLKRDVHLQEERDKADDWGVEITDPHLFNDHVYAYDGRYAMIVLLGLVILVLGALTAYDQHFNESNQVARDLQSLQGFCFDNPGGFITQENIKVSCEAETTVITFTK